MCAERREGQATARIAAAADRPAAGQKTQTCPKKRAPPRALCPRGKIVGKKGAYDFAACVSYHVHMKQTISNVGKGIGKGINVLKNFTGVLIFVFMALLFLQVIMRFVFRRPIYGIDEAVTALMIWSMCFAWAVVYWENEHAVLEFIMKKMPTWFRKIMFNVTNLIILVITLAYLPGSWTLFNMQKNMPPVGGLPFSRAFYYALPVLVMSVIMLVLCCYKTFAFFVTGDESICAPVEQEGGSVVD